MKYFLIVVCCLPVITGVVSHAVPSHGSCVDFPFPGVDPSTPVTEPVPIKTSLFIRTLRQGVPIYQEEKGFSIADYLHFDIDVKPIQLGTKRIQVAEAYSDTPLGWIDQHELLCQVTQPLMNKGLPRKAFVKITFETENSQTPAYPSPNRKECSIPFCEPIHYISDFKIYFVFAEDKTQERYLIAEYFILGGARRFPLTGWIDQEKMIPWNSNLGIRPKNDDPDAKTLPIIAYYSLEESQQNNQTRGIHIMAGNIWYTLPLHIPVIEKVAGHYHVVTQMRSYRGFSPPDYSPDQEMPIYYWQWINQIRDFYIPIREGEMQEEIALRERDIDQWVKLLQPLTRLDSGLSARELREKFVEILSEEIASIVGEPSLKLDDPRTLQEIFAQNKNILPFNQNSPLLQYSLPELREKVPDCELKWLIDWLRAIKAALTKVLTDPTLKVSYTLEDYPPTVCPLTNKGKNIKKMVFGPRRQLGEDKTYRYGYALQDITLFWLPMELLP
jgi:hypothetical protein